MPSIAAPLKLLLPASSTIATLTRGIEATLLTTMIVREDSMTLYGFTDGAARDLFVLLQTVTGVGPRLAMAALAVHEPAELAAAYAPTDVLMGEQLPYFINFAPQHHYVLQAAIPALREWVRTGRAPSSAPPIQLTDSDPAEIRRDERGVAVGGVRTPWVDVPTAVTTGTAAGDQMLALLFGTGEPFDPATLAELYPGGAEEYLRRFTEALDRSIEAGFLCDEDRAEILDLARTDAVTRL